VTIQWGYVDPVERVHEHQAPQRTTQPNWPPQPVAPVMQLDNVPAILYGNGPQRWHSPVQTAAIGAVIGALLQAWWRRRKARTQQAG
jgi:hypothetical protein